MSKNWLESLCNSKGITFYELSKRCGVAQSTLSNIKKKNISIHDIRFGTALSIAYGLGMTTTDMIDRVAEIECDF